MKGLGRSCAHATEGMVPALLGALPVAERLDLEEHASRCARCADRLRDLAAASIALDRAFAPLRVATTRMAAGRARLVSRAPATPSWTPLALVGRLAEASLAFAVTAVLFVGAAGEGVRPVQASAPSVVREYFRNAPPYDETAYFRWLRLRPAVPYAYQAEAVRFPAGGAFDADPPPEIVPLLQKPH